MTAELELVMKRFESEILRGLSDLMHDSQPNYVIGESHRILSGLLNDTLPALRKLKEAKSPNYIFRYLEFIDNYLHAVQILERMKR